ncbi:MAG: flagellar hook-associated protein FlgK [Fibrobacterales bacterium]
MGILDALNTGINAVQASQLAIDVTGQNISNANTDGYSRKRVSVTAGARRDDGYGEMGTGVDISGVERIRNVFIDRQIDKQLTEQGYYEVIDKTLERIENVFNEPSDNSLTTSMDDFWNSWQDLVNNPADLSARETVRASGEVLVNQFHTLSTELRDFKLSVNGDIEGVVEQVNGLTKELYRLNEEITQVELSPGSNANDSRDRRDLVMKELSELIPIDYFEDEFGKYTVTTMGNVIVTPSATVDILLGRDEKVDSLGNTYSEVIMKYSNNKREFAPASGRVGGMLESRDERIESFIAQLNEMASVFVEEVNSIHNEGYTLNLTTGVNFFEANNTNAGNIAISSSVLNSVNSIAAALGGQSQAGNVSGDNVNSSTMFPAGDIIDLTTDSTFVNRPDTRIAANSMTVVSGGAVMTEGVDYTVDYLNGTVTRLGGGAIPALGAVSVNYDWGVQIPATYPATISIDLTSFDPQYTELDAASVVVKDSRPPNDVLEEGPGGDYVVDYDNGIISFVNTARFVAGDTVIVEFNHKTDKYRGRGDGENALNIANIREQLTMIPDSLGNPTQTIQEYYSSFIGRLGVERNEAEANKETREHIVEQLNKRQQEISGVSLDEEMANMIKFEHTFQASAKFINTVDTLLQTIIGLGA